jgi:hypothetical protein
MAEASPGTFDLEGGELCWSSTPNGWNGALVQLLDYRLVPVESVEPDRWSTVASRRIAGISSDARSKALFVRAELAERSSAPAPISRRAVLRAGRREPSSGSVARALAQVVGGDLDFALQQAFEELCREDARTGDAPPPRAVRPAAARPDAEDRQHRVLNYNEFMRSRPSGSHAVREGSNTFSGWHTDTVRDLLNRLTGRAARPASDIPAPPPDDDEIDDGVFGLGDEEAAQRGEATVDAPAGGEPSNVKVDAALFQKKVRTYCDGLLKGTEPLGPPDVLRFRLWILIVLHHARCPDLPLGLQVNGEESGWPRMLVRLLSAFFCKPKPALARLVIGAEFRGLPEDYADCWATAIWAVDALARTLPAKGPTAKLHSLVPLLRAQMLTTLVLGPSDLAGSEMVARFEGLDATLGSRLALTQVDRQSSKGKALAA